MVCLLFLLIRRIRDHPESGRLYKWRFGFQLVLAYLSFSMGMRPIVTIEVGKGPQHTAGKESAENLHFSHFLEKTLFWEAASKSLF